MSDAAAELSTATGAVESSAVQIGEHRFEVRPLTIGQMGPLLRAFKPALPALQKLFNDDAAQFDITDIDASQADALIEVVAAAVRVEREQIYQLDLAEFAELAGKVLLVNKDFFFKRLVPLLRRLGTELAIETIPGAGSTASAT